MLKYLILLCSIISIIHCLDVEPSPCILKKTVTSEHVKQYCEEVNGTLRRACCFIESTNSFPAIDLSNASITALPPLDSLHNFASSVVLMDLRSNPIIWQRRDLFNLTKLDRLILSTDISCPGGKNAWENITNLTDENAIQCTHQKNICTVVTSQCPANTSICSPSGPNQYSCFCKSEYYGYKCLRTGHFPWAALIAPTGVVTLVASAFLFWTQRRHVKK